MFNLSIKECIYLANLSVQQVHVLLDAFRDVHLLAVRGRVERPEMTDLRGQSVTWFFCAARVSFY